MVKIIIVDDESASLRSMGRVISRIRKDVEIAGLFNNINLAMDFLRENSVDIILSDIKMPGGGGIELARFVQENYPEIKIVFFSAYNDFEYAQQAIILNVKHYLSKPVNIEELNDTLNHLIELINKENKTREEAEIRERKYNELLLMAKKELMIDELHEESDTNSDVENMGMLEKEVHSLQTVDIIKKYIDENYMYDILLEDIAKSVNLSSYYTSKLFKIKTGQGLSDYIIKVRINKAIEFMKTKKYKIYEISEMCGYTSRKYFSHAFKQYTGYTPSEYQRKL